MTIKDRQYVALGRGARDARRHRRALLGALIKLTAEADAIGHELAADLHAIFQNKTGGGK